MKQSAETPDSHLDIYAQFMQEQYSAAWPDSHALRIVMDGDEFLVFDVDAPTPLDSYLCHDVEHSDILNGMFLEMEVALDRDVGAMTISLDTGALSLVI